MSLSSGENTQVSDAKVATEPSPAGMNSITNTIGMHPNTNDTLVPTLHPHNCRRGSCDKPGCTSEHSGKTHE